MADSKEAKMKAENKICFVICPIGADGSETRKRSNQVLKHIIEPAAKTHHYDVVRADKIAATGIITTQVVQHLMNSALVIADLTDSNANVFYELAVRHMLRKPYIQMIHKSQPPPFDVASIRTLLYNHLDLDEAEVAREELTKQIEAVKDQKEVQSPISVAIDLDELAKSDNPEQRQIADLLNGFTAIQGQVTRLERLVESIPLRLASLPSPNQLTFSPSSIVIESAAGSGKSLAGTLSDRLLHEYQKTQQAIKIANPKEGQAE